MEVSLEEFKVLASSCLYEGHSLCYLIDGITESHEAVEYSSGELFDRFVESFYRSLSEIDPKYSAEVIYALKLAEVMKPREVTFDHCICRDADSGVTLLLFLKIHDAIFLDSEFGGLGEVILHLIVKDGEVHKFSCAPPCIELEMSFGNYPCKVVFNENEDETSFKQLCDTVLFYKNERGMYLTRRK